MKEKNRIGGAWLFTWILLCAFGGAVLISCLISWFAYGEAAVPLAQIGYDAILAVFVACVQSIWIGSEKDGNKKYVARTIVHFSVLVAGMTALMYLFGWLPPVGWPLFVYLAGFIGAYALVWLGVWKAQGKRSAAMNEKLDEYKRKQ